MTNTRSTRCLIAGTSIAFGAFGWANVARADAAVDWQSIAVDTLCRTTPPLRPGPHGFLDLAVVQAAVFDSVQSIGGKYKPYHVQVTGASGSKEAAAAKAAHDVLVNLYPTRAASLNASYKEYLSKKGLKEDDPGVAVGQKAAAGIAALRANDGRIPNPMPPPFHGENVVPKWRSSPAANAPMGSSWMGTIKPFSIQSGSQFRSNPPPALTSEQYAKDYDEVKAVGAAVNSTRTPEQTELANFYHSDHLCLTFLSIAHGVAAEHVKNIDDSSRLLLLVNMALADALITSWDSKRYFGLWRPSTAIQQGENDGNPATAGDPAWRPFLNDPPYSDYTSGANAVTAAITHSLALFFGKNDVTFTVASGSPSAKQKTRIYNKFSDMQTDMVNVRIYQGIHFRFADTAGRDQGKLVADWVFKNVATAK